MTIRLVVTFALATVLFGCSSGPAKPADNGDVMTSHDYNQRAMERYDRHDYEGAIGDYDQALKIAKDDMNRAVICSNRGNARMAMGNVDGAIKDFDEAIRLNSRCVLAWNNRGWARFDKKGDIGGAIKDFDEAIRIDSTFAEAYGNRALARGRIGDKAGEAADYRKKAELEGK